MKERNAAQGDHWPWLLERRLMTMYTFRLDIDDLISCFWKKQNHHLIYVLCSCALAHICAILLLPSCWATENIHAFFCFFPWKNNFRIYCLVTYEELSS